MTQLPTIQYPSPETGVRVRPPWPWHVFALWVGIWIVPAIVFIGAVVSGMRESFAAVMIIFFGLPGGIVTLLFIPIAINFLLRRLRATRARAMLSHVEKAVRLNLPLVRYLTAASVSEKGAMRKRLLSLIDSLSKGAPVAMALGQSTPEIPARTIGILVAAENAGRLKEVLIRQQQQDAQKPLPSMDSQILGRLYPLMLVMFLFITVTGIMIFVIPKFKEIFRDFRITLPHSMENLLSVSNFFAEDVPWLLPLFLFVIAVMMIGPHIVDTFLPRERKLLPLVPLRDAICWHIPPLRTISQSRNFADLFYAMGESFAAGRPANVVLRDAANIPFNSILSGRLYDAAVMVETGNPLPAALAQVGFSADVCQMISVAVHANTLPETCKFIGDIYASRHSRLAVMVRSAFEVVVTLTLGWLVYSTVYPIMACLTMLLNSVTGVARELL